jgi:hypothetical protein
MQTPGPHREHAPSASPRPAGPGKLPGIEHTTTVASGEGGVG